MLSCLSLRLHRVKGFVTIYTHLMYTRSFTDKKNQGLSPKSALIYYKFTQQKWNEECSKGDLMHQNCA